MKKINIIAMMMLLISALFLAACGSAAVQGKKHLGNWRRKIGKMTILHSALLHGIQEKH